MTHLKKILLCAAAMSAASGLGAIELDFTDSGKRLDPAYAFSIRGKETALLPEGLQIPMPEKDIPSGIVFKKVYPAFVPAGAFEFEAEFCLHLPEKIRKTDRFFLLDNKYVFNGKTQSGFMVYLDRQGNHCQATVQFGLEGNRTVSISLGKLPFCDGKYHTLKFRFDPSGRQEIQADGKWTKTFMIPPGKVGAARYPTVAGNRFASRYGTLGGIIRRIRIVPVKNLKVNAVDFIKRKYGSRRAFVRREKNSFTAVTFTNTTNGKITGMAGYSIQGTNLSGKGAFSVEGGKSSSFSFPAETNLMPGKYTVDLTFTDQTGQQRGKGSMQYMVVPEFTDRLDLKAGDFFSVKQLSRIKDLGITIGNWIVSPRKEQMTDALKSRLIEQLDSFLEHGLRCNDKVVINQRFSKSGKFLRVDRNGKPYARRVLDVAEDTVYLEGVKATREAAAAVGSHPAWCEIYPNNELRDGSRISFTDNTRTRLKKATGLDIPSKVDGNQPVSFAENLRMPWNRIVSVSDPELRFWTWFWKEGDGWDRLNGDTAAAAENTIGRKDFSSRFAPSTRALPYLGIGGKISEVCTWTYNNPDPIRLGQTIDELAALADKKKNFSIGNQGIWYRNQVAPKEVKVGNPPDWLSKEPDARYISPSHDMMLEAFWIAIAHKVEQISTHGQGAWLGPINHKYRYTNPEITNVFPEFMNEVGKPLGTALKHVDEVTPEVVMLESFTNALYGGGHTWGWGRGWIADLHMALQWAHIQPGICYEEQLLRGDYDSGRVKILILPSMQVLSDRLLVKIRELQKKGILILGDEYLNISLLPDLRVKSLSTAGMTADARKKGLQKVGAEIRKMLAPVLTPCFSSPSQDLILRRRASGEADYIFAVNDKREYGNYVGQWKKVMEKGVPLSSEFTVRLPFAAAYDIVRHEPKSFSRSGNIGKFSVNLKPGSGSILVLLPRSIADVALKVPETISRGQNFSIEAFAVDKNGKVFKAILPMEVKFLSGETVLPGTGYYATDRNGKLIIDETAAFNMPQGKATLTVRCLVSGLNISRDIMVK